MFTIFRKLFNFLHKNRTISPNVNIVRALFSFLVCYYTFATAIEVDTSGFFHFRIFLNNYTPFPLSFLPQDYVIFAIRIIVTFRLYEAVCPISLPSWNLRLLKNRALCTQPFTIKDTQAFSIQLYTFHNCFQFLPICVAEFLFPMQWNLQLSFS